MRRAKPFGSGLVVSPLCGKKEIKWFKFSRNKKNNTTMLI